MSWSYVTGKLVSPRRAHQCHKTIRVRERVYIGFRRGVESKMWGQSRDQSRERGVGVCYVYMCTLRGVLCAYVHIKEWQWGVKVLKIGKREW